MTSYRKRLELEKTHPENTGGAFLDPCHGVIDSEAREEHDNWNYVKSILEKLGVKKEIPHDERVVFQHAKFAIEAIKRIRKTGAKTISKEEIPEVLSRLKKIKVYKTL